MKGQSGSHYNFDIKSTWNIITIPNAGTNWPSMIVHQNQCLMRQGDCHWPKHGNLMCWNAIILDYIASHDIVEEEQLLLTHVEFCLHQLCHDRKICLNLKKYVLIFLLLGSQHAVAAQHLHYNVSATPNFVLGMYFEKTSYLCLSPVPPQPELKYCELPLQALEIGMFSLLSKINTFVIFSLI